MLHNKTVTAILVAAGSSTRMGFDKLEYPLGDTTVLGKSLAAFDTHPMIDEIILVTGQSKALTAQKPMQIVQGGATRVQSVLNGLQCVTTDYIAIHDAARPFVSAQIITQTLEAAFKTGAAAPAVPVKDTIKVAGDDGAVRKTPSRASLFAVQTPQCFCTKTYQDALRIVKADDVTDDCSVLERAGLPVTLTKGSYENYKITTREDLPAEKENTMLRIGHGYDVHQLVEGRKLILGGVTIPFEKGLQGHSDADVLAHAVMDALLGGAALGDIGKLFPDTSQTYKNADSIQLLKQVGVYLKENGYTVGNIDATILCQAPKLAPHIPAMRSIMADALKISVETISVKATTEEHLGFTGAGQGIAAHAVCLLQG